MVSSATRAYMQGQSKSKYNALEVMGLVAGLRARMAAHRLSARSVAVDDKQEDQKPVASTRTPRVAAGAPGQSHAASLEQSASRSTTSLRQGDVQKQRRGLRQTAA